MRRFLQTGLLLLLCALFTKSEAQTDQTVGNAAQTTPVNFPAGGCTYQWTNSNPTIGLPASGTGDIPAFNAINNTGGPITATITATPVASGFAYITNRDDGTVSVINTTTNLVTGTFPAGLQPFSIATSSDGSRVYIANISGTVTVINTTTNAIISTIATTGTNRAIAVSPDGSKLYVTETEGNNNAYVLVINTSTNSIVSKISIGVSASGICVSPDGSRIYTCSSTSVLAAAVFVIDASTNTVISTIPVNENIIGITTSHDGSRVYVCSWGPASIVAINTSTNTVIGSVGVGIDPIGVCITPDDTRLYVANEDDGTVSVVDANTLTVTTTLTSPVFVPSLFGISITPDGKEVFVVNQARNSVSIINTGANAFTKTIDVGLAPIAFGNFTSSGPGCNGTPITFKITVNSGPTPVVTTSTITGNIIGCVGSPGESPNVGKFTVAGTSLSGDITVTPPPGFDLSLTAIGGYSTSLTLKQIGGTVINVPIYIRSSAADPVGPISGNIQLTTPGATADVVPVTGVVNALPTVDPVQNVSYNSGATTTPINFTGTGNTFTWTNDNPTIGLPASGSGPIPAFQTTNTGSSPVIATITVTPTKPGLVYITQGSNIVVINSATNSFFKIPLTNAGPYGVAASSDGNRIYMSDPNSNSVYGINTTTNVIELTIHTIDGPRGLAVSPDGNHIYITDEFTNQIAVASTVTGAVIATIPVGISPLGVAVSPDGSLVYVANQGSKTVSVINTSTNKVTATIPVTIQPNDVVVSPDGSLIYISGSGPGSALIIDAGSNTVLKSVATGPNSVGESLSPDGNRLYVVNEDGNSVSVIDTKTQAVIATIPVGGSPQSISVTSNGNLAYVVGQDGNIYIIDTSTNLVINTLSVGIGSLSFGSFITPGTSCPGTPITFTITLNSLSPSITAGPVSGSISACLGSASAGVNIQQFTVSGSNLTGDITATAPAGFEISLTASGGYGGVVTIPQSAGIVSNVTVYVRSAAADPSGSISGNVVLSSPGATSQNVPVSGTVNALPTANAVTNQTKNNGGPTDPINFTGTGGDTYNWTNDVPGIGLPASGTGNIPSFNTIDVNGDTPVTATLTVTPLNTVTGCTGAPVTFTITVNPASPPVITSSGTLTGLNTIYGAASSSETFTVSATNLTEGILVTAPQGFEVSADNQTFSNTITAGQAGNITNVPVYIRLAATTPAGNYFGNIVLSTIGASDVNVSIPISVVNRAILTVTAPDVTRAYGTPNPVFIPQYQGFVNGDNESGLTVLPELTTVATTTSPEGKYAIHVTGGSSHNYIINPVDGTLTIIASESEIIIPNAFTPNGDGINDLWTIQKLSDFPQCLVSVYTRYGNLVYQSRGYVKPWDGTVNGSPVPTGTYYYVINPNVSGFGLLSGYVAVLR